MTTPSQTEEQLLPEAWLGFSRAAATAGGGELNPAEQQVQTHDLVLISTEVVPRCTQAPVQPMPSPTAALSESYRNPEGLPGSGFALEFATPAEASVWLTSYGEAVKACVGAEDAPFRLMEVDVTDTLVVDVRNYNGSVHSERADVDGNIVRLLTIQAEETLDNLRLTP